MTSAQSFDKVEGKLSKPVAFLRFKAFNYFNTKTRDK